MAESENTKKNEFVELSFTGYANGEVFDSNILEDLKKIAPEAKPNKTVIAIGNGMVILGLDNALVDKELNKEYEFAIKTEEGFGARRRELVKTLPMRMFTEKRVMPQAGMTLRLDNSLVKIIAVSGARVTVDFNNPLAGKEIKYKVKILRKVSDDKEKAEALFMNLIGFVPEVEISDKIKVKGPKQLEMFIKPMNSEFKRLIGKELEFQEKKKEESKTDEKKNSESKEGVKSEKTDKTDKLSA